MRPMSASLSRRDLLQRAAVIPAAAYLATRGVNAEASGTRSLHSKFARLEHRYDARLGVFGLATGNGRSVTHRADERFPFCSTYKALAAAAILQRRSLAQLNTVIHYGRHDLVTYSPITAKHVETGMTLRAVCDAAIRFSDNTAGNLLFRELGGPGGLTHALRGLGDRVTRSNRLELDLNTAIPGDRRDTSTPRALAADYRKLAVGDALPQRKRSLLNHWLVTNTTGDTLIRAGVPPTWTVGDKTGAGEHASRNDVAVIWPPKAKPIVLAVLSTRPGKDAKYDDALIAQAARIAVGALI